MLAEVLNGWGMFLLAFVAFFLTHAVPVRPGIRQHIVRALGPRGFTVGYSILSFGCLAWLVGAAIHAPVVALWPWAPWQNLVTLIGMVLSCLLVAMAVGRPNPLSFGGARNDCFDPEHPGIVGWSRHPLLLALVLWSGSHVVPNGQLALVLLFVPLAFFAGIGGAMIDRRKQRQIGLQDWRRLAAVRRGIGVTRDGVLRVGAAVLIYALLLRLHGPVIGVDPLGGLIR